MSTAEVSDPQTQYLKDKVKDQEELISSLKQLIGARDYEIGNIRRDAETVVGQWRDAVKTAESNEKTCRSQLDETKARLQQVEIRLADQQRYATSTSEEANKLREQLNDECNTRRDATSESQGLSIKLKVVEQDAFKAHERVNFLEDTLDAAGTKMKSMESQIQALHDEKLLLETQNDDTLKEVSKWKSDAVEASALVVTLRSEIKTLREECQLKLQDVTVQRQEIQRLEEQRSDVQQQLQQTEIQLSDEKEKCERQHQLYLASESTLKTEKEKYEVQSDELNCLSLQLRRAEENLAATEAQVNALRKEQEEMRADRVEFEANAKRQLEEVKQQNDGLHEDLQEAQDEGISHGKIIAELQVQLQFIETEVEETKEKLQSEIVEKQEVLKTLNSEKDVLKQSWEAEMNKNTKLAEDLRSLQQNYQETAAFVQELQAQKVGVDNQFSSAELERKELEAKFQDIVKELDTKELSLNEKESKLALVQQNLAMEEAAHHKLKETHASLKDEYLHLNTTSTALQQKCDGIESQLKEEQEKGLEKLAEVEELRAQLEMMQKTFAENMDNQFAEVENAKMECQRKVFQLEDELAGMNKEKRRLMTSVNAIEQEKYEEHQQSEDLKHQLSTMEHKMSDLQKDLKNSAQRKEEMQLHMQKELDYVNEAAVALKEELSLKNADRKQLKERIAVLEGQKASNDFDRAGLLKKAQLYDGKSQELEVEQEKRAKLKQMFEELKQRCDKKDKEIEVLQGERDEVIRNHDGVVLKYNHLFEIYKDVKKKQSVDEKTGKEPTQHSTMLSPTQTKLYQFIEELKSALSGQLECCRLQQTEFHKKCEQLRQAQEQLKILNNRLTLKSKQVAQPQDTTLSVQPLNTLEGQIRRPKKRGAEIQINAEHHQPTARLRSDMHTPHNSSSRVIDMNQTI